MRISDWSSDVCSSDLSARQHLIRSILHLPRFGPICIDRLQLPRDLSVIVPTVSIPEGDITMKTLLKTAMLTGACMIAAPALAQTTPADPAAPQQIGRASCRERVCQYV